MRFSVVILCRDINKDKYSFHLGFTKIRITTIVTKFADKVLPIRAISERAQVNYCEVFIFYQKVYITAVQRLLV